jgi:uroporphyrin-III C-methyltransferase
MAFEAALDLTGRLVVCTTGGAEVLGVLGGLVGAGAQVLLVAPDPVNAVRDVAPHGRVRLEPREFRAADLDGAALVVCRADQAEIRAAAAQRAIALTLLPLATAATPAVPARPPQAGKVVLVGGGPGDPGLLTIAGLRAIQSADVVVSDRLAPLAALREARADAELIDVAKIPRGPQTSQTAINDLLVRHARAGRLVVRLKGGDSFVFGRGGEEWEACARAGIPVEVLPGVSSATAAPALAGIPLTHRTLTQGFTVVSGHLPPGDPGSTIKWEPLARAGTTLVVLMGVATLPAITATLLRAGLPTCTPAATIARAGMPGELTIRGTLGDIAAEAARADVRPPAVTIIGAVAGFDPSAGG